MAWHGQRRCLFFAFFIELGLATRPSGGFVAKPGNGGLLYCATVWPRSARRLRARAQLALQSPWQGGDLRFTSTSSGTQVGSNEDFGTTSVAQSQWIFGEGRIMDQGTERQAAGLDFLQAAGFGDLVRQVGVTFWEQVSASCAFRSRLSESWRRGSTSAVRTLSAPCVQQVSTYLMQNFSNILARRVWAPDMLRVSTSLMSTDEDPPPAGSRRTPVAPPFRRRSHRLLGTSRYSKRYLGRPRHGLAQPH